MANKNADASTLVAVAKQNSEQVQAYKNMALARRRRRKYTQALLVDYWQRLNEYWRRCEETHEPLTVSGSLLAIGVNSFQRYSEFKGGQYDYLLEELETEFTQVSEPYTVEGLEVADFMDDDGEVKPMSLNAYSDIFEKCDMMILHDREKALTSSRGNPAGNIYLSKAFHNMQDQPTEAPRNLTQNLIVSDSDRARDIIKLLNG